MHNVQVHVVNYGTPEARDAWDRFCKALDALHQTDDPRCLQRFVHALSGLYTQTGHLGCWQQRVFPLLNRLRFARA
jgi:hypothetical protein